MVCLDAVYRAFSLCVAALLSFCHHEFDRAAHSRCGLRRPLSLLFGVLLFGIRPLFVVAPSCMLSCIAERRVIVGAMVEQLQKLDAMEDAQERM